MKTDKQHPCVVLWKSLFDQSQGRWTVEGKFDLLDDAVSHATQLADKRRNQRGELRIVCNRPNEMSRTVSIIVEDGEVFCSLVTDEAPEYESHVLNFYGATNLD